MVRGSSDRTRAPSGGPPLKVDVVVVPERGPLPLGLPPADARALLAASHDAVPPNVLSVRREEGEAFIHE